MKKTSNNRHSKNIIITILLLIIILVICSIFVINSNKVNTYKEIDFEELTELVDSGDNFILFIGSNTCSHCTLYKETLNIVIKKYHVVVNYIDINNLKDEEISYIKARFAFSATPTTVFVDSGNEEVSERVLAKKVGSLDSSKIIELFKKYNYIKE